MINGGEGYSISTNKEEVAKEVCNCFTNTQSNNWFQRLALPAVQIAAQIGLLEYQRSQFDDIEEDRINFIEAALAEWNACIDELLCQMECAIDEVPEPAMYQPVSAGGEQLQSIADNMIALGYTTAYAREVEKQHEFFEKSRIEAFNPKYFEVQNVTWCSIADLVGGALYVDEAIDVITDQVEQNAINNRLGVCCLSNRSLGLRKRQIEQQGREEFRATQQLQNITFPNDRLVDLRSSAMSPNERIAFAITQAQLIQNADQNAYNACAKKAPYLFQQLQLNLQRCVNNLQLNAGKANLVSTFVPDYGSILGSQINNTIDGIFGQNVQTGNSSSCGGGGG